MISNKERRIQPEENNIKGRWMLINGNVIEDENCKRIRWLINKSLKKIISDYSGWNTLYKDPNDCRLWEFTYPESDYQGGGPPMLTCISIDDAKRIYGI